MDLHEFPKPEGDTGIGIHWSFGEPAATGLRRLRQRWLPLLKLLGVKWVRFRHAGGETLAELLLDHDIMPIVQLRRFAPYPGRPAEGLEEVVRSYVALGVRYFELGERLDDPRAWQDAHIPADAVSRLVEPLRADVEMVLEAGGLPGLPASLDLQEKWDLIGALCRAGHAELLRAGVWQAYSMHVGNLPLEYPDDPVNLMGRPLSADEYEEALAEEWPGHAWGGMSRQEVNQERLRRRDPDATVATISAGWRRYEALDLRIRRHLGRSIPILGTAGGPRLGDRLDPRYPALTPQRHAERVLAISRALMGTSKEHSPAPGYLFCAAFSVLGNYALGNFEPAFEDWAWVSPRWERGRLPVVELLGAEPKRARLLAEPLSPVSAEEAVAVMSGVALGAGSSRADDFVEPEVGRPLYELLRPVGGDEEEAYVIPPTFAPEPFAFWPPASLQGKLKGGAGRKVLLSLARDGSMQEAVVGQDETFVFRNLRPGVYALRVDGTNLEISRISLASGDEKYLELEMPAWRWHITKRPASLGFAMVLCSVEGKTGLPVRIWNEVWDGMERLTGSKPALGPYYCELAPLAAGRYWLQPRGIAPAVELELETDAIFEVVFTPICRPEPAPSASPESAPAGEAETAPSAAGLDLYLLLARPLASKEELSAVLRFIQRHTPACGFSVEEASWARRVLIVGGANLRVTEDDEQFLRQRGCQVRRVAEHVAETLTLLARQGDPMTDVTADITA